MNSVETVKKELGNAIGEETGWLWKNVDVKEWHHVVKQKIFKHAFVRPFEAMEMLMVGNDEKSLGFRSGQERHGGK